MTIPKRLKKWCLRLSLFVVVCCIITALAHYQFTHNTAQAIETHVAEMKTAGKPMRLADFVQEEVAPGDDAKNVIAEFSSINQAKQNHSLPKSSLPS